MAADAADQAALRRVGKEVDLPGGGNGLNGVQCGDVAVVRDIGLVEAACPNVQHRVALFIRPGALHAAIYLHRDEHCAAGVGEALTAQGAQDAPRLIRQLGQAAHVRTAAIIAGSLLPARQAAHGPCDYCWGWFIPKAKNHPVL